MKFPKRALALSTFLVSLAVSIPSSPILANGADSPEAAFEAGRSAAEAQDWKGLVELFAPSARPMMALEVDMAVGMMVELWEGDDAEQAKAQYEKARADFEVPEDVEGEQLAIGPDTPQEEIDAHMTKRAQALYGDIDTVGYVSTLIGLMLSSPMMEGQPIPYPTGALTEVQIDGDRATGQVEDRTLVFVQEDGRWYLTPEVMQ